MRRLNLNDHDKFTIEGVRKLIASVDDSVDRQLRITDDSYAVITGHDSFDDMEGYASRANTWDAGENWCGPTAAEDDERMKEIFRVLMKYRNTRGRALVLDI